MKNKEEIMAKNEWKFVSETARCMKCRRQIEVKDGFVFDLKNGAKMIKGICPDCGTKVCKILKKTNIN